MSSLPERDLVTLFRDGDNDAGNELYTRYKSRLAGLCYNMMHDSDMAGEMVQETFYRLLKQRHLVDPNRNFGAFVHRMAFNLCIDAIRKRKVMVDWDDFSWVQEEAPSTDDAYFGTVTKVQHKSIWKTVEQLPTSARTLIELRYRSELTPESIAEVLGVPASTIRVRLHRARKMLADILGPDWVAENETT